MGVSIARGVAVLVAIGVAVFVTVGGTVGVSVGVGVSVAVGVGVSVAVGVAVSVAVGGRVAVGVGVAVAVEVGVGFRTWTIKDPSSSMAWECVTSVKSSLFTPGLVSLISICQYVRSLTIAIPAWTPLTKT